MVSLKNTVSNTTNTPLSNIVAGSASQSNSLSAQVKPEDAKPLSEVKKRITSLQEEILTPGGVIDPESGVDGINSMWQDIVGGLSHKSGVPKWFQESWFTAIPPSEDLGTRDEPLNFNKTNLGILDESFMKPISEFKIGDYFAVQLSEEEQALVQNARAVHWMNKSNNKVGLIGGASPEEVTEEFNYFFKSMFQQAQAQMPDVAMMYEDPTYVRPVDLESGTATGATGSFNYYKYDNKRFKKAHWLLPSSVEESAEYRTYRRAVEFDEFLQTIGATTPIRKIMRDNWTSGGMVTTLFRTAHRTTEGLYDFGSLAFNYGSGYINAVLQSAFRGDGNEYDVLFDKTIYDSEIAKLHANMSLSVQNAKNWMDKAPILATQTEMLNDFIKAQYIEKNGEEAYEKNKEDLLLGPEQAGAIYKKSFDDLSYWEGMAVFMAENFLTSWIGGKTFSLATTDSIKNYAKIQRFRHTTQEAIKVDGRTTFVQPYALTGMLTVADQWLKAQKRGPALRRLKDMILMRPLRLRGKMENAHARIKSIETSSMNKEILTNFDKAQKNYNTTWQNWHLNRSSVNKRALTNATAILDKAEEAYTIELIKKAHMGKTAYSNAQLRRLYKDEIFPTFFQNHFYHQWEGSGQEEGAGAVAYMGAVFAKPVIQGALSKTATMAAKITPARLGKHLEDSAFEFRKFMTSWRKLSQWIGMDDLLNPKIMELSLYDKVTGRRIEMTPEKYNELKFIHDTLHQQDPILAEEMIKSAKSVRQDMKGVTLILDKHKDKIDDVARENMLQALEMTFGQQAMLDVLAAYSHKLAAQLRPSDVVGLNKEAFITYSKNLLSQKEMLRAQQDALNLIKRSMLELQPQLSAMEMNEISDIYKLRLEASTLQEEYMKKQMNEMEAHIEMLTEWMVDPRNTVGKSIEEIGEGIESIVDVKWAIIDATKVDEMASTVDHLMQPVNVLFEKLYRSHQQAMEEYTSMYLKKTPFVVGENTVKPTINSLKNATVTLYELHRELAEKALEAAYLPIKNATDAKGNPVKIQLVGEASDAYGKTNQNLLVDIIAAIEEEEFTSLQSAFKEGTPLSKMMEGKGVINAVNGLADDAMIKHSLKAIDNLHSTPDIDLEKYRQIYPYLFDQNSGELLELSADKKLRMATMMANDYKEEITNGVRTMFNISETTKTKDIQSAMFYKYMVNEGHNLENIEIDYYSIEQLRSYVNKKAGKYSTNKESPEAVKRAKAYYDLANRLENLLEVTGNSIKITIPKLDLNGDPVKLMPVSGIERTATHEISLYDLLRRGRFDGQSLVYTRTDEGQLIGNFEKMLGNKTTRSGRVYKGYNLSPNVLNTAFGKNIVKQIFTDASDITSLKEELQALITTAYGKRVFKKGYEDWDSLPLTKDREKDLLENGIEYVLDMSTPQGQMGYSALQSISLQLVREMQIFDDVLRHGKNVLQDKDTFAKRIEIDDTAYNADQSMISKQQFEGTINPTWQQREGSVTFLSTADGAEGIEKYQKLQEALMFDVIINGEVKKIPLINLDQIQRVEQSIINKMNDNVKVADMYNSQVKQINILIKKNAKDWKAELETKLKFEGDLRSTINVNSGEDFHTTYFKKAMGGKATFNRVVTDAENIINFNPEVMDARKILDNAQRKFDNNLISKEELNSAKTSFNKIHATVKDKVHKSFLNLLIDSVDHVGKRTANNLEITADGKKVMNSAYSDPFAAFEYADSEMVRSLFEHFGVDTKRFEPTIRRIREKGDSVEGVVEAIDETKDFTHYDAMMGILGHMVMIKQWENSQALVPGSIPHLGYSDGGLISRAFNYARGMVGGPYLAVEASFKVMRDNDMNALHWLLNDKEAAKFMTKALLTKEPISKSEMSTFAERMAGWIARQLAEKGAQASYFDKETVKQIMEEEQQTELNLDGLDLLNQKGVVETGATAAQIAATLGITTIANIGSPVMNWAGRMTGVLPDEVEVINDIN